jgi:hypothetical protein
VATNWLASSPRSAARSSLSARVRLTVLTSPSTGRRCRG